jgi:hypothetical protein
VEITVQSASRSIQPSPNQRAKAITITAKTVIALLNLELNRFARILPTTPVSERGGGKTGEAMVLESVSIL